MKIKLLCLIFLTACSVQRQSQNPVPLKIENEICKYAFSRGMTPLQAAMTSAQMKSECGLNEDQIQLLALE